MSLRTTVTACILSNLAKTGGRVREQMLQTVRIEADHKFAIDENRRSFLNKVATAPRLAPASLICNTDFGSPTMVRHYLIKGRVQGVGFRWYVHREAATLGLRGWVRNTEDGHVEVLAAGEPDDLATLRLLLDRGSRGSRVDAVIEHKLDDSEDKDLETFQIEGAW